MKSIKKKLPGKNPIHSGMKVRGKAAMVKKKNEIGRPKKNSGYDEKQPTSK